MKLNDLRDNPGARKKSRPLGRGIGSGRGKTAGHGGKGQHGRSGVRLKSFEGGQTPLARRLPKRGFTNIFRLQYAETSLSKIQEIIDRGTLSAEQEIDCHALEKAGLFKRSRDGVRILGGSKIKVALNLVVSGITRSAREAVESAGGTVTLQKGTCTKPELQNKKSGGKATAASEKPKPKKARVAKKNQGIKKENQARRNSQ
jgi:large subunit ribosomal protein L15